MSKCFSDEFAELFAGMSMEDLDECARSFRFEECLQRDGLNKILEAHAEVPELSKGWVRPAMGEANGHADGKETELELD
jgi:hypothetical protein